MKSNLLSQQSLAEDPVYLVFLIKLLRNERNQSGGFLASEKEGRTLVRLRTITKEIRRIYPYFISVSIFLCRKVILSLQKAVT